VNTIRAFVAIDLPSSVRSLLLDTCDELRNLLPSNVIRWVPTTNIHLTLKFLGNAEADLLPSISNALDLITTDHDPFRLQLAQLGCFPNPRKPRVVWIGINGETSELMAIQKRIESSLISLGWEPDSRNFHPHLTLGRVKDSKKLAAANFPWGHQFINKGFLVDSITLFESQLLSGGARYIVRHKSKL